VKGIGRSGRWRAGIAVSSILAAVACSGGSNDEPAPAAGFSILSGQTVLVLPVQYIRQVPGGWPGEAPKAEDAARQADVEIAFALGEHGGRARWVTADQLVLTLNRRPGITVDPFALSAGEAREKGGNLKDIKDPLYGEIRVLAALFDSRYTLLPLEIVYMEADEEQSASLGLRTFLLDARRGDILWYGIVREQSDEPPASAGALASLAQQFAAFVSP
jgi:hypothetical protein